MSFVRVITTNVKSPDGLPRTTHLGQYTLLVGPNESGKSTIAEAVQLALTGSASGILYRDKPVKSGKFLGRLMPEGNASVKATAQLDTGEVAEWRLEAGKAPKNSGQMGHALPINELKALMSSSDDTIRSFFYSEFHKSIDFDWEDLLEALGAEFGESLSDRTQAKETDLNKLITLMGKKKREYSSLASSGKKMLEQKSITAVSEADLTPLWEDLEKAQKLAKLRNMYQAYSSGPGEADFKERAMGVVREQLQALGSPEELKAMGSINVCRARLLDKMRELSDYQSVIEIKQTTDGFSQEIEVYSELEEGLKLVRAALLNKNNIWEKFSSKVNTFLPKGDVFQISDSGGITIGLEREGGFHQALSGSTEARTLGAMAAALVSFRGEENPAVIILDDRMWDMKTLAKTMAALESIDCQVIVMSTSRPKGKPRKEWTYIDVGGN
tara:strand:+ start:16497 stop:17822 length:1326 start_codon:yes stop_codon:yes gene_type:complete